MTKRSKDVQAFPIRQGYACRCDNCESDRAGESHADLIRAEKFCAGCGHGYLSIGTAESQKTSSCMKCGAVGQWLPSKPVLPFMPKPEAIDRALAEARVVVARLNDMYSPAWISRQVQLDYFGLISTAKRLEEALSDIPVQPAEVR